MQNDRVNAVARAARNVPWLGELYTHEIEALRRLGYNVEIIERRSSALLVQVWHG